MNQGNHKRSGMSSIVKTVSYGVTPLIFLYGIYQVLFGHTAPGGGFAGGVIIASGFILLTLGFGKHLVLSKFSERHITIPMVTGILIFLWLAAAGLLFGDTFFESFIKPSPHSHHGLFSTVFILIGEIAIALLVSMSLFLAFSALSSTWKNNFES